MNQQTFTTSLSAYPAAKASDMWLWQELSRTVLNDGSAEDDASKVCSLMSARLEKILLTTRGSWAKN